MRRSLSSPYIFVLMITLGLLIALQGKALQSGVRYVPLQQLNDYNAVLESETASVKQIKQLLNEKKNEYEKMNSYTGDDEQMIEALETEIYETKRYAGLTSVNGTGVVVLITDGERELLENEDPNNIIVHDVDIRTIVDELRYAGAEAISINGERILFNISYIHCNGPTIRVNSKVFSQPFIIRAIGDKKHLEAAINAPGQYGNTLRQWGLFVEVNTKTYMEIDAFTEDVNYEYLNEYNEGEVK